MKNIQKIGLVFAFSFVCINGFSQSFDARETAVFSQAEPELQELLSKLILQDPNLKQVHSTTLKQEAKSLATNSLAQPELGINWSPIPMQKSLNHTLAFRAMQQFPWPGTIRSSVDAQNALSEQNKWLELAKQTDRMLIFRKTWYDSFSLKKQLEFVEEQKQWLETQFSDLQTKLTTSRSQSELIELEIEQLNLEQKKIELTDKLASSFAVLSSFMGEISAWEIPDTLIIKNLEKIDFSNIHPVLLATESKKKSGMFEQKLAHNEGMPMIGLGAEYMLIDEAIKPMTPEMQMQSAFTIMATISLPVYRNKISARQNEAKAMEKEAQFEAESIQNELKSMFETLQNQIHSKRKELELYGKLLPEKWNQMRIFELEKWRNGSGSFSELIRIEQKLIELKQLQVATLVEIKKLNAELDWVQPYGIK